MQKGGKTINTETILQTELTECGAACLTMILRFYGQMATLDRIRMETDVSRDGCSAGNIVRAARKRGLQCEGYELDTDGLAEITPPSILWWENDHFVVFEGVRKGRFLLNDPAYGKRSVSRGEMERGFSGIVLTFAPGDGFYTHPDCRKKAAAFAGTGAWGKAMRSFPAGGVIALLAGIAARAIWIGAAAALCVKSPDQLGMILFFGVLILLALLIEIWSVGRRKHWERANELQRSWPYVRKLLFAPIEGLEDRYPENLVEHVVENNNASRNTVDQLSSAVIDGAGIVLCLILMGRMDLPAAVPIILALCLSMVLRLLSVRFLARERTEKSILETRFAKTVFTDTEKRELLRDLGREEIYTDRLRRAYRDAEDARRSVREKQWLCDLIRFTAYGVGVAVSFYFIWEDMMAIAWIMAVVLFVYSGERLAAVLEGRKTAGEKRTAEALIDAADGESDDGGPPAEDIQMTGHNYRKLQGNIDAEGISFWYGSFGAPLFEDLTFHIPGGSFFVITGGTGCGKSTLGKLMASLMPPSEGRILYDGRPAEEIPGRVLRASIAVVGQNSALFAGTIEENITMWNPHVSREEITRAAADACISECIQTRPKGYSTVLGQDGRGLSGGEQQRIEIARALAGNPSILILDEAFSAIDDETTIRILENIRRRGCTCILITRDPVQVKAEVQGINLSDREAEA